MEHRENENSFHLMCHQMPFWCGIRCKTFLKIMVVVVLGSPWLILAHEHSQAANESETCLGSFTSSRLVSASTCTCSACVTSVPGACAKGACRTKKLLKSWKCKRGFCRRSPQILGDTTKLGHPNCSWPTRPRQRKCWFWNRIHFTCCGLEGPAKKEEEEEEDEEETEEQKQEERAPTLAYTFVKWVESGFSRLFLLNVIWVENSFFFLPAKASQNCACDCNVWPTCVRFWGLSVARKHSAGGWSVRAQGGPHW